MFRRNTPLPKKTRKTPMATSPAAMATAVVELTSSDSYFHRLDMTCQFKRMKRTLQMEHPIHSRD